MSVVVVVVVVVVAIFCLIDCCSLSCSSDSYAPLLRSPKYLVSLTLFFVLFVFENQMATAQDGKQCQCMILLWRMLQITLLRAYSRSPTHCFLTNFEKSCMQKPRSAPNELFLNFINCFSLVVVIRSVRYVWIGDCYNVKTNSFMFHRTCGRILRMINIWGVLTSLRTISDLCTNLLGLYMSSNLKISLVPAQMFFRRS